MRLKPLADQILVITGASSGTGLGHADQARGHALVLPRAWPQPHGTAAADAAGHLRPAARGRRDPVRRRAPAPPDLCRRLWFHLVAARPDLPADHRPHHGAHDGARPADGRRSRRSGPRDNLFDPKKDGSIDGSQANFVRRRSRFLQAKKHPLAATALLAGAGVAGAIAWRAATSSSRRTSHGQ